jgi:FtsH-binding integral membrane protein
VGVAVLFALVYSLYIIVDTQLILGGKNKELSLDDYVLGSVILYTDIISLFLKLLQILGKKKDE